MEHRSRANVRPSGPPPTGAAKAQAPAREKTIVNAIIKCINQQPDCTARKTHGGAYGGAGWPDVVAVVKGTAVMLEVKRPGGKGATDLQRQELQRWHNAGAVCAVVRSVDDARRIVAWVCSAGWSKTCQPDWIDVGGSWDLHPV